MERNPLNEVEAEDSLFEISKNDDPLNAHDIVLDNLTKNYQKNPEKELHRASVVSVPKKKEMYELAPIDIRPYRINSQNLEGKPLNVSNTLSYSA